MKVYLVRHGETPLNAARIVQYPDTPLSERGVKQADRVGQRLASAGVDRILTSDYMRARATADAVGGATGAPIEVEPLLRERNFGIHRGCAYDALEIDVFAPDYHPPEGESAPEFETRVTDAWAAVRTAAARARGPIAVVSHGLVCRTLVRDHLVAAAGIDPEAAHWVNTCMTEIEVISGPRWRITRLACAEHLNGPRIPRAFKHEVGVGVPGASVHRRDSATSTGLGARTGRAACPVPLDCIARCAFDAALRPARPFRPPRLDIPPCPVGIAVHANSVCGQCIALVAAFGWRMRGPCFD